MPSDFLSEIILITIAAFVGGFVARTLKFPPVLGYIISGIIFGIVGKNFFESFEFIQTLSEFGVSLLLFTLGFEISIDSLKKIDKKVVVIGLAQVTLVTALMWGILLLFRVEPAVAFLSSILFSFSSTALIVKILEERGLLNNFPGNNVFIILLIQDLFIIPVIFFLPLLFSSQVLSPNVGFGFLISILKPILVFIVILFFGKFFLARILTFLFRYPSQELTILATIFTATLSILLLTSAGLPQAIAALLAGILISEQGKNLTPLLAIRPFRDLFLVLFFVLTGMLLDFSFFVQNLPKILLITLVALCVKFVVTYVLLRASKYSPSASMFISSYLSNVGEFAVVIAQIAFLSLFITLADYNLILSVFVISLVAFTLFIKHAQIVTERVARLGILGKILHEEKNVAMESGALHKFENHVVICGHGRVGREVRSMLDFALVPYVVVDFNRQVINDLLASGRYAIYGDPTDEDIMKASFIAQAKVLVVAVADTFSQKKIIELSLKQNPKIVILCRSHIEEDRYDLINMGVNTIIMPEFEAGLRMGSEALAQFGVKPEDREAFTKRLRRQHLI